MTPTLAEAVKRAKARAAVMPEGSAMVVGRVHVIHGVAQKEIIRKFPGLLKGTGYTRKVAP